MVNWSSGGRAALQTVLYTSTYTDIDAKMYERTSVLSTSKIFISFGSFGIFLFLSLVCSYMVTKSSFQCFQFTILTPRKFWQIIILLSLTVCLWQNEIISPCNYPPNHRINYHQATGISSPRFFFFDSDRHDYLHLHIVKYIQNPVRLLRTQNCSCLKLCRS